MSSDEKALSFCFLTEILLASIIGMATVLKMPSIVSPLFYISIFVPGIFVFRYLKTFPRVLLLLVACCIANVSINGMLYDGVMNFDYYKKVIMFLVFMVLIYYSIELKCCRKILIDLLEVFPIIAGLMFVIAYYYLGNTSTWGGGLSLGFSNPNTAGMWLLHLILYGILFLLDSSKGWMRFLYVPVIMAMLPMLELTRTRSCYIALAFFAIMLVLRVFKIKANKVLCLVITVLPIVYAIVYLNLVYTNWFQTKFSFMASEGKTLNSRVGVWNESFESIKEHFVFGNYCGISNGTGQSQLHNTHVDVLASYGVVPFLAFLKIIYDTITTSVRNSNSFYKYAAISAFCAVLIMGTFEAAMVAGSMGLNLLTVGLIVLANSDGIKREEYILGG